jgi:hypothetical protein
VHFAPIERHNTRSSFGDVCSQFKEAFLRKPMSASVIVECVAECIPMASWQIRHYAPTTFICSARPPPFHRCRWQSGLHVGEVTHHVIGLGRQSILLAARVWDVS